MPLDVFGENDIEHLFRDRGSFPDTLMGPRKRHSHSRRAKVAPNPPNSRDSSKAPPEASAAKPGVTPLQQLLADLFPASFPSSLVGGTEELQARIQRIKQCLYMRDFTGAFADPANLKAYALRWSPTRALAYHDLFCYSPVAASVEAALRPCPPNQLPGSPIQANAHTGDEVEYLAAHMSSASLKAGPSTKVVAFGGGAGAEIAAIAGALAHYTQNAALEAGDDFHVSLHLVDVAPWSAVVSSLESNLAGQDGRYSGLIPARQLRVNFIRQDALNMEEPQFNNLMMAARLVTFLFTLNELYSESKAHTTALLLKIGDVAVTGTVLLVVDSPGSYATVDVGKAKAAAAAATGNVRNDERALEGSEHGAQPATAGQPPPGRPDQSKAYPMQLLLDHTLLRVAAGRWRKVAEERSRWFRRPDDLVYPLPLEDMRYQMHCYERI